MPRDDLNRRTALQLFAGAMALAASGPAAAGGNRINGLIEKSRAFPTIAQRIAFISHAFLGAPYLDDTLIGGPQRPEKFVVRDDGFDCVTFCETILAAARVHKADEFGMALRRIRYHAGRVEWRERNHYFSDWCEFNVANGTCSPVEMPGAIAVEKILNTMPGLGRQQMSIIAVPAAALIAHPDRIATGDVIGFLSQRPGLDFFHTGFVVVDEAGELHLRHAAKSKRRVLDERLAPFLAVNRVRYVTLLRPQEPWPARAVI
jgi:hypothetical protein